MPSFENFPNSPEEYRQRQEDLLRQDLEREFDEENGDLKEDLSEEKYEKKKQKWVEEEMEKSRDLEDSNQRTEKAISEEKEARIDSITKLERREWLYKNMNQKVKELLDVEDYAEADKWVRKFREASPEDFRDDRDPAVMMADVSYLNLVNRAGHEHGDELLDKAGKSLRELEDTKGFRHGGDELTAIFENSQEVSEKTRQIEDDFESQKIKALENKYGLKPKIDVATASFSESLGVMKEVLEDEEAQDYAYKKNPLRMFNDIWVEIADKRVFQNKARDRIKVMMDKYENSPEIYKKIKSYIHKGAYEISDRKIEELLEYRRQGQEEKVDQEIEEFLERNRENALEDLRKQEEEARSEGEDELTEAKMKRIKAETMYEIVK